MSDPRLIITCIGHPPNAKEYTTTIELDNAKLVNCEEIQCSFNQLKGQEDATMGQVQVVRCFDGSEFNEYEQRQWHVFDATKYDKWGKPTRCRLFVEKHFLHEVRIMFICG